MKEFKLAAWPDLPGSFQRTVYRRMLSDLSHRYVSEQQLMASSGASRPEARALLQMLGRRGLLDSRDADAVGRLFGPLTRPLGAWLRRRRPADPDAA